MSRYQTPRHWQDGSMRKKVCSYGRQLWSKTLEYTSPALNPSEKRVHPSPRVFSQTIKTRRHIPISPVTHYDDIIMCAMASQTTSLTIVYSTVYSGTDERKHRSSASLTFVRGIHRGPVNSPHKWPVMRKMFPFDDVIMWLLSVEYHPIEENNKYCFLKAGCTPSQRLNDPPHELWVLLDKATGSIQAAYCTCFAGYVIYAAS